MFVHMVQFSEQLCSLLVVIFDLLWAEIVNFRHCETLWQAQSFSNVATQPQSLIVSSTLVRVLMFEHLLHLL